jgi:hypothetical protein
MYVNGGANRVRVRLPEKRSKSPMVRSISSSIMQAYIRSGQHMK